MTRISFSEICKKVVIHQRHSRNSAVPLQYLVAPSLRIQCASVPWAADPFEICIVYFGALSTRWPFLQETSTGVEPEDRRPVAHAQVARRRS